MKGIEVRKNGRKRQGREVERGSTHCEEGRDEGGRSEGAARAGRREEEREGEREGGRVGEIERWNLYRILVRMPPWSLALYLYHCRRRPQST